MNRILDLIIVCVVTMVASSCNIDEVTITPFPEQEPETSSIVTVYDYTPAPGQFIGDTRTMGFDGTETTREAAIAYAQRRLDNKQLLSLGAFGGYVVVGIKGGITNREGDDFAILGNAFDGSSEPGIVWVMRDENGNAEPDDTWYELEGSESFSDDTIQHYEVTYYRPEAENMDVEWEDNLGGKGVVEHLASFHNQAYYYPTWIAEESYTLVGKCLKSKSYDKSGNGTQWVNPAFEWGYADNASAECVAGENRFDIARAVATSGESVALESVDFVKVQCAIQQQCGWIGEVSTEIKSIIIIDNE